MSTTRFPSWLEAFQTEFSDALRTPLDATSGTLRAVPTAYPGGLRNLALPSGRLDAGERLAVYNRQYWFRLFTVFHGTFPLTARLLGYFTLNHYVSQFLLAQPPHGWNLDDASQGFAPFLAGALPSPLVDRNGNAQGVERLAVVQAAHIDAAHHAVFRAPWVTPFTPLPEHAARLLDSQLLRSPAVAILEEDWALCELRQALANDRGEAVVKLPPRLPQRQFWLLGRNGTQLGRLPLEPLEARLLGLLEHGSVSEALANLEREHASSHPSLIQDTQRWLAASVQRGFWRDSLPR